jgi:hypothetical protein
MSKARQFARQARANCFHAAVLSLLQVEGSTLLGVSRLLTDKRYRAWVTSKLCDPLLGRFWTDEYERLSPTLQREAISPVLNKVTFHRI